jgi:DNA-binding CsgD family transcriptional regulator
MAAAGVAPRVVGRDEELDLVRAFVAAIDRPKTLVIEGEPGIGKTTVWQEGVAAARAGGSVVLTSRPNEVETSLSFSAVSDLLEEAVHDVLPELPAPQREALEVALLLTENRGARPERRAVATAFLGGLRVLSRRGPVLIAIDDLQWLDRPSAAVIGFAIRRLREEPVAVLLSVRRGTAGPLDADERITLGPLSLGALHSVLHERLGSSFPRPLLRRLHETAGGNPYFALELGAALLRRENPPLHGEALPVPESLDELLRERLADLPPDARPVLPIVAALSEPSVGAVEVVLPAGASLDAAVRSGALIVEGDRVRFAHPLLASFVYAELGPQERRSLHRMLAVYGSDPEHRARHLALGSEPPDEDVASELDVAGARAAARGAPDAAAELAEQAVRFTPAERVDDVVRRRRLGGEYHFAAGDTARAREMFEATVAAVQTGPARATSLVRLAEIVEATEGQRAAAPLYRQALEEAGDDPALCATAHWRLAGSVTSLGEGVPAAAAHAHAAVELAERAADRGLLALALAKACVYDFYLGRGIDREAIGRALSLEDEIERVGMWLEERPSTILGAMTMYVVDFEAARARFERARELAEQSGNERALPAIFFWLSRVAMRGLSFEHGREFAREGAELAQQTGQEQIRAQLLFSLCAAEAYSGNVDAARAAGRQGLEVAERTGDLDGIVNNLHSLGLTELMLDNRAEADRHFSRAVEIWDSLGITEPRAHSLIPDAVEAAATIDPERAESVLAPYERHAQALGEGWPLAAVARCRGHLALARGDLEDAIAQLAEACAGLEAWTQQEVGRALLALGQAQRRARRKREARRALDRAAAIFERIGAPLWLARVHAELARIGGRRAAEGLTPTEERIASLVAAGRSNKEVAAALHVTPRTVEGHLTHIYEKLGVRSRAGLAHRLGGAQRQGVSGV